MAKQDVERALEALTKLETPTEARAVMRAAREQWKALSAHVATRVALTLRPGAQVTFKGRRGSTVKGTVVKVNRTTAHVAQEALAGLGRPVTWRVPLATLTIIQTAA